MPIYVYCEVLPDGTEGETFEVAQTMRDAPLTAHPLSGHPVRRVYVAPNLGLKHTSGREKSMLDNSNVARHGFTKYEKDKVTGRYNRVAGSQGPASLDPRGGA